MRNRSPELLPVIEEIAKIGCYETDMTTGCWMGSENFIKIFGLEKKEKYTVEEFQALVHPDDFEWVMNYFKECLQKRIDFNCEYRCLDKNGEVIYVNSRSKVFYSPTGVPLRVLGVKQDITASKKHEGRLVQLNENNKKKNEVLSMVAHDLRSPISQLEGLIAIMKRSIDADHHDLLSMQEQICATAKKIITELVEIAELEDESYTLKTCKTDISKLVLSCIERFKSEALERKIKIETKLEEDCLVLVNPTKFSRVVDNLISNALKFSQENDSLELSTCIHENAVILKIKDEGIGIKEEHIPLLFKRFSRTIRRTGMKGEQSTGLGLSIVKNIVDMHKGTISVESQENKGTIFTIELARCVNNDTVIN